MKIRFVFRPSESTATPALGAIVCRITVDKARKKFTTPITALRRDWDAKAQRVKGVAKKARLDNAALSDIEAEINRLYFDMERAGEYITAERLLKAYQEKDGPRITMLLAWQDWLDSREPLIGKDISAASHSAGQVRLKRLRAFLTHENMPGLLPEEFTPKWCDRFISWMRVERKASQNYTNKVVQTIKQFLKWCVRHEHAKQNPLDGYTLKFAAMKQPVFLKKEELDLLATYPFANDAMRRIADIFLFQCYTGLAYVDLARFRTRRDVGPGPGDRLWIFMQRQKTANTTGLEITVPLLPRAMALINRYGDQFPVPTNQVYNRMLKEMAAVLNFPQRITTHVGRKTAGRLLLDEGISMEAVSKVLGHKTVAMTERVYVRVGEELVEREFRRVFGKGKASEDQQDQAA